MSACGRIMLARYLAEDFSLLILRRRVRVARGKVRLLH